jgi:apolipoprotein N-acyltransferase
MDRRLKFSLFALGSGLMLSTGWFAWGTGLPLLIAFVPLLWIEDYYYENRSKHSSAAFLSYIFPAFFIWYALDTWWLWNASVVGMFVAILLNSTLFSIVFWLSHIVKRRMGAIAGYIALLTFWVYWEYFYMHGEITWPWLNLGNGLAHDTRFIQWYEFTGSIGGSFWIILVNILIFVSIKKYISGQTLSKQARSGILTLCILLLPIFSSLYIFYTYKEKVNPRNMVVIQPNIDPYNEKFFGLSPELQTQKILKLGEEKMDSTIDYLVAPETALNDDIWLNEIHENRSIRLSEQFMKRFPRAKFVLGVTAYWRFEPGSKLTSTARPLGATGYHYDSYNAAIQIDSTRNIQKYYKSILVVGVEKMPYAKYLKFIQKITLRLGGTFRSHAIQEKRSVLCSPNDSICVAPVICYESVFGEFVTDYIKLGAQYIFILTNDGWWGNTPGFHQHNSFASLRAIENRRSIARSANTGISSFINQRGEISQATSWWTPDVIKASLNANSKLTFYTIHGDYIARICGYVALVLMLLFFGNIVFHKFSKAHQEPV